MVGTVHRWRIALVVALTAAMLVPVALPAGASSSEPRVTTIAEGLVGPLGLAVGHHGTLYVAEAFGGQVTRVARNGDTKVLFRKEGVNVLGGIEVNRRGRVVFTMSKGSGEASPPNRAFLAKLTRRGNAKRLAALSRYEVRNNPDAGNQYGFVDLPDDCDTTGLPIPQPQPYDGLVDSNPYAVANAHHGSYYVADAAGNDILKARKRWHRHARIRTVAVLPPIPQEITAEAAAGLEAQFEIDVPDCVVGLTYLSEPVPTDVEVGPHGHLYVSALPGSPELPGTGTVFKVNRWTGAVRKVADGFSGATDLAVDRHGRIYVAELFGNRISVIKHGRVRPYVEVPSPGAIEIGRHGTLYATTDVFGPDEEAPPNGKVVKITRRH
jgi:hypothetical protein